MDDVAFDPEQTAAHRAADHAEIMRESSDQPTPFTGGCRGMRRFARGREMDNGDEIDWTKEQRRIDVGVAGAQPEMQNGTVVSLTDAPGGADDLDRLRPTGRGGTAIVARNE